MFETLLFNQILANRYILNNLEKWDFDKDFSIHPEVHFLMGYVGLDELIFQEMVVGSL